jgi:FRG domain/SET domain
MTRTYTAEDLTEFLAQIKKIEQQWNDESDEDDSVGLWFRGCQKSQWPLVPSLYRTIGKKGHDEAEDDIREEFVRRALVLAPHKPQNSWEWYFLMQHYGAPTRLLDWTDSALLGLYYAVKDNNGLHDSAVWVLDPWWLNGRVLGEAEVLPPASFGLVKADEKRYRPWLPDRFDPRHRLEEELPVAIYPNHFDPRIAAQRSCFTIHGVKRGGLEVLFPKSKDRIAKVIIPGYATEDIRQELDNFGIDEVAIYPDLRGLGVSVTNNALESDSVLPHKELYTRLKPSKIDGVGVFAIRPIKKGALIFRHDCDEMMWIKEEELPKRKDLRQFYKDFAVWKNGRCGCPSHFHRLTMSWYLNDPPKGHSANVICDANYDFRARRNIRVNEELTVESRTYSNHREAGRKKSRKLRK